MWTYCILGSTLEMANTPTKMRMFANLVKISLFLSGLNVVCLTMEQMKIIIFFQWWQARVMIQSEGSFGAEACGGSAWKQEGHLFVSSTDQSNGVWTGCWRGEQTPCADVKWLNTMKNVSK